MIRRVKIVREHKEKRKEVSSSRNKEDINEYTKRLYQLYKKSKYLDKVLFFRI